MGLNRYRDKRHFKQTTEPAGDVRPSPSGRMYVVQKHAASRLHYDFRLELDGVLKSWAVPKGPSLDPSQKRLAVHVEDHPVDYGNFEGTIPQGEYGGGTVMLWDRGTWEPEGNPADGYVRGRLKFSLSGRKLRGLWMLTRMADKKDGDGKNWLLFKLADRFARKDDDILDAQPLSVATEHSMDQIASGERDHPAAGGADLEHSLDNPQRRQADTTLVEGQPDAASLSGAQRAAMPDSIKPQLATLVERPPQGNDWLHEIKYDGYRILAVKTKDGIRLMTRGGKNWSERFPDIVAALETLPANDFWLDGEMVITRADGTTDFQALQNFLRGDGAGRLGYYLFDIIYLEGIDLSQTPLLQRKRLLQGLLKGQPEDSLLYYSDHILGRGGLTHRHACRHALEGIVSKRIHGPYRQRRSPDWAKTKCTRRQEFVVAGFSRPSGSRVGFGALLLGYYDDSGTLHYAGRVGTGFNQTALRTLADRLEGLRRKSAPFKDPPTGAAARDVAWVAPTLVAEVAFTQWTEDGRLRHPAFKGLREDKAPAQVLRETPAAVSRQPFGAKEKPDLKNGKKQSMNAKEADHVAGILLSHPDRVLYPDQGATKIDVARYYAQVAERMLPHVIGRPLTMVRCPQGRQKKCFYQKHLTEQLPDAVKGVAIDEKKGTRTYLVVEDLRGIVALVQLGALEFHPWGSRVDRLERPDRLIFDLDPGPGVDLGELVDGCRLLRQRLLELDLTGFLKTSGGKGFHIVVPLVRRSEWDKGKAFCRALAEDMTRRHPQRFIATMSKSKRNNKIFVDYLRNTRGATSVAPFSTRARPGAPVSAPLAWEELSDSLQPNDYTIENLPYRLASQDTDPWADFFNVRQSITMAMKRELGVEGGR